MTVGRRSIAEAAAEIAKTRARLAAMRTDPDEKKERLCGRCKCIVCYMTTSEWKQWQAEHPNEPMLCQDCKDYREFSRYSGSERHEGWRETINEHLEAHSKQRGIDFRDLCGSCGQSPCRCVRCSGNRDHRFDLMETPICPFCGSGPEVG